MRSAAIGKGEKPRKAMVLALAAKPEQTHPQIGPVQRSRLVEAWWTVAVGATLSLIVDVAADLPVLAEKLPDGR